MQVSVPQFTDVEDKLIASLTLKQFLILLAVGGVVLFFWSIFGPSLLFFFFSLPIAIIGVGSALGRYNGRPMFVYLVPFAAFLVSQKMLVFKREKGELSVSNSEVADFDIIQTKKDDSVPESEPAESRLKKLAYMLDQKVHKEEDILDDVPQIVSKPAAQPKPKMNVIKTVNTLENNLKETVKKFQLSFSHPEKPKPKFKMESTAVKQTVKKSTKLDKVEAPPQAKIIMDRPEKFYESHQEFPPDAKAPSKKFDPSTLLKNG